MVSEKYTFSELTFAKSLFVQVSAIKAGAHRKNAVLFGVFADYFWRF